MQKRALDDVLERERLLGEVEQLKTALENSLEENARLTEDRDRLMRRVMTLSRDLQASHLRHADMVAARDADRDDENTNAEEELRAAFEELQVLTEELEVSNAALQDANRDLDEKVDERTAQLTIANEALRATEASFQAIANLVPDLLWRANAGGDANWFNDRWFQLTGQTESEPLDKGWFEAVHPMDRGVARALWTSSVDNGEPFQRELRIAAKDGDYRWFLIRAEPVREQQTRICHWFTAGTDIHDQRLAMETIERSELRFRTLIEGMAPLVWRSQGGGKWTWASPQWCAFTGMQEGDTLGIGWLKALHPNDRSKAIDAWSHAQERGTMEFEARIFDAAHDRYRHFRTLARPARSADGRIIEWLGTSTDVHDLLELREHQSVLVAELQHRTRNLMTVVQSIIMRTLKDSTTLDHFRACIDDRMQALARVQGLLSKRDAGMRVAFDALLREELLSQVELDEDGNGAQVSIHGPAGVPLRSAIVQTLALALHELATNALKYGALASPEGHLDIGWHVHREEEDHWLHIDWRESGVASMPDEGESPRGGGYGRALIERALPYQLGARTSYAFEADGVHCTIALKVPMENLVNRSMS